MSTPMINAGMPLPRLLQALSAVRWGELGVHSAQGLRAALRGLVDLLPRLSATGDTTAHQVADRISYGIRWTRELLGALEDMGIITWQRGGILDGRPTPGHIRVHKQILVDLIYAARPVHDARLRARSRETAERIRTTLRVRTIRRTAKTRGAQNPLSNHEELSTALPPLRGEETARQGREPGPQRARLARIERKTRRGQVIELFEHLDECDVCHAPPEAAHHRHDFRPAIYRPHELHLARRTA